MSIAFLVTITVISLAILLIEVYVLLNRNKIAKMTGMMIAMTVGMMVGITGGTLIGIIFSDNLFLSTILGMTLGGVVGVLVGAPVGIMPLLDGLLSGIMGGMMGAMLGVMIIGSQADTMIRILMLLFVGIILILLYMVIGEIKNGHHPRILRNPFIVAILLFLFFFIYNQIGEITPAKQNMEHKRHNVQQHK